MYRPQFQMAGIPVPSLNGGPSTEEAPPPPPPKFREPPGLTTDSQRQIWNVFSETVVPTMGIRAAVKTYEVTFKVMIVFVRE